MPNIQNRHLENAPGIFYTDNQCIDCDLCKETAPDNFRRNDQGGYVIVFKQPETPEEEALCMESMRGCPVEAIGNDGDGVDRSAENLKHMATMIGKKIAQFVEEHGDEIPEEDWDRIDCPFCGKMHYPGSDTADANEWVWEEKSICDHLLFLAVDISIYSGFQYRSNLFNRHLGLEDSEDGVVDIPSKEDPEELLTVSEIIASITLPGLELRSYQDPGGITCGPVGGGTITFGFVPDKAND